MFEPAKDFMFLAARKYNLEPQALGALVCERARQLIAKEYPNFVEEWIPQKFQKNTLTIRAKSAASSSALFMQTHDLLECLKNENLPVSVSQISIVKK